MGGGELAPKEKLFLGFALVTLLPIRVILAVTVLVCYYVICRVCTLFSTPNREDEQEDYAHMGGWRRNVIVWCGKALSRVMLFVFGFYWITDSSSSSITQVQFLLQLFINCSISIHQEQLGLWFLISDKLFISIFNQDLDFRISLAVFTCEKIYISLL
jgi:hypothetical protein